MIISTLVIVGGVAGLVVLVAVALVFIRANQVDLTASVTEKPDWVRQSPPKETLVATSADGEGFQVYDHDEGERLASPFAEQIEDIFRARLEADPNLQQYKVDLGTGADAGLEIWVNGKKFTSVEDLPDEHLRQALQDAIENWNKF
jgi:hypothetical protein